VTFQPGVTGNPVGRPKGARNRRTQEILDLISAQEGYKDPLQALSEIVSTSQNPEHRISASNILAPYLHSKRGMVPAPRFIDTPVVVPEFHSITEAENYLARIPVLLGNGELDSQTALELSTLTKNWIDALYARQEYDLKLAAQGGGAEQTIHITGGLPTLPGCENLIMPQQNGVLGQHSELNNRQINGTVLERPAIPPAHGEASQTEAVPEPSAPPPTEPENG
jgi:hypothetical protein